MSSESGGHEPLRLRLLGPPQATSGGRPLLTPEGKQLPPKLLVLLCYLAAERKPVSRKALKRLFWPTGTDANLRVALARLRACEGATEWLQAGDMVEVRASTDLEEFERAVADNDSVRALTLWGEPGEPRANVIAGAEELRLPAELVEFWLEPLRNHAFQRYLEALFQGALHHEERGEHDAALELAHELLRHDPLDESALQRVMRLHARLGDHQAALVLYERARRRQAAEGLPPPSSESTALAVAARAALDEKARSRDDAAADLSSRLAGIATPFVGREGELARLAHLSETSAGRLITVLGPGGAGKSRLVLEFARRSGGAYPDGVVFVPLEAVDGPETLLAELVTAFRLPGASGGDARARLVEQLRGKRQLLILDNFEQLTDGADLVDELAATTGGSVVVTSRAPLGLRREQLFELAGLGFPEEPDDEGLEEHDAVHLFVQSARRADASFALGPDQAAAVIALCKYVAGLPLYIEHLASWTRLLSPSGILEELQAGPELFEVSHRDMPERHRRLDLVLRQSLDRLSGAPKKTLVELAYFRGGFSREAARQVVGARMTDLLAGMDASFLRSQHDRFSIHEALRAFLNGLRSSDEVARRHAEFFLERSRAMARDVAEGRAQLWRDDFAAERDNYLQALTWAEREGDEELSAQLLAALGGAWFAYGAILDGHGFLERFAERASGDSVEQRRALVHLGGLLRLKGELQRSQASMQRALEAARAAGDDVTESLALGGLGAIAIEQRRYADASALYEASLIIAERQGNARQAATILNNLAIIASRGGDQEEAAALYERAVETNRVAGDLMGVAVSTGNLGMTRHLQGALDEAAVHYREAIRLNRELGAREGLRINLANLGVLYNDLGEYGRAAGPYREALELAREMGSKPGIAAALRLLANALRLSGELDDAWLLYQESLAIYEAAEDWGLLSATLNDMALAAPDHATRVELLERSVSTARAIERLEFALTPLAHLALMAAEEGDFAKALRMLAESLAISETHVGGKKILTANPLAFSNAAYLARRKGEPERALILFAYVDRVRAELRARPEAWHEALMEPERASARQAVGASRAAALEALGVAMSREEAREAALQAQEEASAAPERSGR